AATWTQLAVLHGHHAAVTGVLFARDGRRVVTTSADGTILFWDPDAGRPELLRGDASAISADGGYAVTAKRNGEIRVWRSAGGSTSFQGRPFSDQGQPGVA